MADEQPDVTWQHVSLLQHLLRKGLQMGELLALYPSLTDGLHALEPMFREWECM